MTLCRRATRGMLHYQQTSAAPAAHRVAVIAASSYIRHRPVRHLSARAASKSITMTVKRAFQLLGLQEGMVDSTAIKDKYRQLAKQLHPDTGTGSDEAFTELQSAYETILNYQIVVSAIDKSRTERSTNSTSRSARSSSASSSSFTSPFDEPDQFDYSYEHVHVANRRYLNNEGIGYGSQEQRQRQYNIHKLERAFDRVSQYRQDKLFNKAQSELEREKQQGNMSDEERVRATMALVSAKQQRRARQKQTHAQNVEELMDAAITEWKDEAPTLSAYGRPFTTEELMMGVNSHTDILTARMNKIMKNAG